MGFTIPDSMKMNLKIKPVSEEDDDLESDLRLMSLADSPHLDANISLEQTLTETGKLDCSKPKFTRSWSFVDSSEDRKVRLSEVTHLKTCKNPNLRLEVVQIALSRAWSFTDTVRSPQLNEPNSRYRDFIVEEVKPGSPMPSVHEEEDEGKDEIDDLAKDAEPECAVGEEEEEEEQKKLEIQYKVKPLSRSFLAPAKPTEKHWLALSNLDRVVNPTFSSVIHFYRDVVNEGRSFSDATTHLKESLRETLVDFYPLAGRLALSNEGKVDLLCNDAGVMWIEAAVDKSLDEIGGPKPDHRLSGFSGSREYDFARLGPGPIYIPDQVTPMPVLVIQVSKFICGSIGISTSWHHTVADGFSGTHFMRSWAEVAQGKPISVKPIHSRGLLKPRENPNPSLVHGYISRSSDSSYVEAKVSTAAPAKLQAFDLSKEKIAELKQTANLQPPPFTPRPFTSAESISGHLWRQMTKARAAANSYQGDMAKGQPTKFFMFVDGRKRLRLPPGYFGNVVCSACAEAREADILSKPLHYAASLIRIATRNITDEYFRSLIDWVELQGMSDSKSEHVNSLGHDVAATFWTFFPLYDIEFGWGRPVFAARNSPPRPLIDGIAMMPSAEGHGMVALLNLHSDRMSKLQRQISFATVFH